MASAGETSEETSGEPSTKRAKRGKFCVCGLPGKKSCTNTYGVPGISMHKFPKDKRTRKTWTTFVRRHRKGFEPTDSSVICSEHFEDSCFSSRYLLDVPRDVQPKSRYLLPCSIPTKDVLIHNIPEVNDMTTREKRKIIRDINRQTSTTTLAMERVICQEPSNAEFEDTMDQRNTGHRDVVNEVVDHSITVEMVDALDKSCQASFTCPNCLLLKDKIQSLQKVRSKQKQRLQERYKRINELLKDNKHLRKVNSSLHSVNGCADSDCSDDEENEDDIEDIVTIEFSENQTVELDECPSSDDEALCESRDPDWVAYMEDEQADTSDVDDVEAQEKVQSSRNNVRFEDNSPPSSEPKFIVFYTALVSIFSFFCFKCKASSPSVDVKANGTMVTVTQSCKSCCDTFIWRSQPLIMGKFPAGNLLLSFAMLMSGAPISKAMLLFKHLGLKVYHIRTYFYHQKRFLFPMVLKYWEECRNDLVSQLKNIKEKVWAGDGRFDSMGHSAKYGMYTMLNCNLTKIVHFELLQSNEVGSSNGMELEGAKRSFLNLKKDGVSVDIFVSDRHRGIAKWIRTEQTSTAHFYDIWHKAKSVTKVVLHASKEHGCGILKEWVKAIRNHLYWCVTSTKPGFLAMIEAKWLSFLRHISNNHKDHPNVLYKDCKHGEITENKKWVKVGSKGYQRLNTILTNKQSMNDIKRLSPTVQTSSLEGFHSLLNHWHPKMVCFSWMGTLCRHILACLHFNENVHREIKLTKSGSPYTRVTYPKYKLGEELVREISVPATYGYADAIKEMLFNSSKVQVEAVYEKYKDKEPGSLTSQFSNRRNKVEAVLHQSQRKGIVTELFPSAKQQQKLQDEFQNVVENNISAQQRKAPVCRTCHQPRKGHSKGRCQSTSSQRE